MLGEPLTADIEHLAAMRLDQTHKRRMTSIIATIGPASNTPEMLAELRRAGVNIIRLNFSHGTHEYHGGIISNVRKSFDVMPGRYVCWTFRRCFSFLFDFLHC